MSKKKEFHYVMKFDTRDFKPPRVEASVLKNLCVAVSVLSEALRWKDRRGGSASFAGRFRAAVELSKGEREVLAALLTDEFKLGGVHRAAATQGTREDLLGWMEIIAHGLCMKENLKPTKT